ncbi:MAG: DUF4382 domain-containing protein [Armatimonadetes bacterium]|nr:DUF4382 domain-containing protein [Armatimonadota bacterium]
MSPREAASQGSEIQALIGDEPPSTISKVQAHVINPSDTNDTDESHFVTLSSAPQTINLSSWNRHLLGSAQLPPGRYSQVRLFVTSAQVTDRAGQTFPVTVPGGAQTGIKVNVDYTVTPNEVVSILLDFNIAQSLIQGSNGNYRLQPVVKGVVKALSGTITDATGAPLGGCGGDRHFRRADKHRPNPSRWHFQNLDAVARNFSLTISDASGVTRTVTTGAAENLPVQANQNTGMGTFQGMTP